MAAIIGSAARAVIIATFPRLSDRKLPNSVRTRAIRPLNRVFRTFLNIGQCSTLSLYAEITRKLLLGPPKLRPLQGSSTIARYNAVARANGASKERLPLSRRRRRRPRRGLGKASWWTWTYSIKPLALGPRQIQPALCYATSGPGARRWRPAVSCDRAQRYPVLISAANRAGSPSQTMRACSST